MAKSSFGHRFRAPPPSPIATGKGLRSAAVDDPVLSNFLDDSIRVPDLNLPQSHFPSRSPLKAPPAVDYHAIVSGDEAAVRSVLSAAADVGAMRVIGGGETLAEEARAAIEAGREVFATLEGETTKGELGIRWFGRRGGVNEEFYWYRLRSPETERLLQRTWPASYGNLRYKMENIAARLELVADCIAKVLSEHVPSQTPSKKIGKVQSILCLRKHVSHHSVSDMMKLTDAKLISSDALSLHISGDDHEFCIRRPEGSAVFLIQAGDIVVTIGKRLQELCNGELKSASAEALFQPTDDTPASFSLEYMCSPLVLSHETDRETFTATFSLMDQLLMALVLLFLYNFLFWILS
ncbi:hypothetical protein Cni_G13570 [Canna indica]|uniref:Uncharacterized protein n=1 Tax=Canna indica TaxID=4628 RepID=A0AAQ3K9S6_9LILI|nr:hypothetical protein Cni_G13570 [Canna indica]